MTRSTRTLLTRHPANPILHPRQFPGVDAMFNPTALRHEGKIVLFVSCTTYKGVGPGHGFRQTHIARSDDGIRFELSPTVLVDHEKFPEPFRSLGGVIDCRVTKIDDWFYFLTPQGAMHMGFAGCCTVMYRTKNFVDVELVDIVALPFNRGSSLFPEKINGMYYKLDRPGEGNDKGTIWISSSPDLIHWGRFRPLLTAGYAIWNTTKIGPTVPIKTKSGWLVLVHGVDTPCDGPHYSIGAILLDLNDPGNIIGLMNSPLLQPDEPYETNGRVDNVCFPCGALADEAKDELHLYYGAADTCVCLATGKLSDIVRACLENL
jgi:predicted GH43/DUF377 family glycosyl hydrolase